MNVWMAIFGFIGNYFWTHYFFNLLGAAYTLPSHKLNGVSSTPLLGSTADAQTQQTPFQLQPQHAGHVGHAQ